jgi:hypothetical protein
VLVYIINHNFIIEQIVHTKDDALAYARATPLVYPNLKRCSPMLGRYQDVPLRNISTLTENYWGNNRKVRNLKLSAGFRLTLAVLAFQACPKASI